MLTRIEVDNKTLDINALYAWLNASKMDGAVVTFEGKVRSLEIETLSLYLEHYQGMTEKVLANIVERARERWTLNRVVVVHRVGDILANESIVFVGVSSGHRQAAFAAAEFIMDILKNEAPFWKREKTINGEYWIDAKDSDKKALMKWY
ncbi:MAG: molybdopterin synthase catalytic subunit MoaE [Candidatus Schmidhempelia sp.]|nr:molybdopterin synthase catalytic subunit MoaE [Candidatus Schmidhempelia sp.]